MSFRVPRLPRVCRPVLRPCGRHFPFRIPTYYPMPNLTTARALAAALAMAVLMTACGGDDDDDHGPGADPGGSPGTEQPAESKPELRCAP